MTVGVRGRGQAAGTARAAGSARAGATGRALSDRALIVEA